MRSRKGTCTACVGGRHCNRVQARAERQSPHLSSAGSTGLSHWAVDRVLLLLLLRRRYLDLLSTRGARRNKPVADRCWSLLSAALWLAAACPLACCRLPPGLLPPGLVSDASSRQRHRYSLCRRAAGIEELASSLIESAGRQLHRDSIPPHTSNVTHVSLSSQSQSEARAELSWLQWPPRPSRLAPPRRNSVMNGSSGQVSSQAWRAR